MEMRTSRIGKMAHDLVGGQKQIQDESGKTLSLLEKIEERQRGIACDVESLLVISAEAGVSQRVGMEGLEKLVEGRFGQVVNILEGIQHGMEENVVKAIDGALENHLKLRSGENSDGGEELLHGKLDNIAEVIDFVNKSQCRLVSLMTMNNVILESLTTLDDHMTRTARDQTSRQNLLEVWLQRNHESLKQIQLSVSNVEKMDRSASSGRLSPSRQVSQQQHHQQNQNQGFEDEKRISGLVKELEKRAAGVLEDMVLDLKESWSGRQKRVNEEMETLLVERAGLLVDVSGLRKEKRDLEEDVERLKREREEFEVSCGAIVKPIGDAVEELERELMGRIDALVGQIESLKREREGLLK
ncbi:UNVERIFIED_CONTAM: hypothetical protein HDU68_010589 [Siphonaria sp. JEL0065]|nr:hypothetical protein HDU68_010589 [Siphonaria sp. JEL0065]